MSIALWASASLVVPEHDGASLRSVSASEERRETYVTIMMVGWGRARRGSKSKLTSLLRYRQTHSHLQMAAARLRQSPCRRVHGRVQAVSQLVPRWNLVDSHQCETGARPSKIAPRCPEDYKCRDCIGVYLGDAIAGASIGRSFGRRGSKPLGREAGVRCGYGSRGSSESWPWARRLMCFTPSDPSFPAPLCAL